MVTQAYDAALQPSGLRATQFTLLATLAQSGDLPMTQLAEAMVMDRTTLTRNLKPLVEKDFVRVQPDADQRVRRIVLTDTGLKAFEAALPRWQEAQSRLVEGLQPDRWMALLGALQATVAVTQEQ